MAADFFLDPEGVRRATRRLGAGGDALTQAYQRLEQVLIAHHGCWGTDEIGEAFGKNYAPREANVRSSARDTARALPEFADSVDESSETFQEVDDDNARRMDRNAKLT